MKKIAVFASGGGTDFQSIIDANEKEAFCKIEYLIAGKPNIGAIARAEKACVRQGKIPKQRRFLSLRCHLIKDGGRGIYRFGGLAFRRACFLHQGV